MKTNKIILLIFTYSFLVASNNFTFSTDIVPIPSKTYSFLFSYKSNSNKNEIILPLYFSNNVSNRKNSLLQIKKFFIGGFQYRSHFKNVQNTHPFWGLGVAIFYFDIKGVGWIPPLFIKSISPGGYIAITPEFGLNTKITNSVTLSIPAKIIFGVATWNINSDNPIQYNRDLFFPYLGIELGYSF